MLTVYVDDMMLGGPASEHDEFWQALMQRVKLDDPEPVSRFLGRYHEFAEVSAPVVDIREYFVPQQKQAVAADAATCDASTTNDKPTS